MLEALAEMGLGDDLATAQLPTWVQITEIRDALQARIRSTFATQADAVEPALSGGLRGTLSRRLPTTLCLILVECRDAMLEVSTIWAGDSRAYMWLPDAGLLQLTRDHTRNPIDALEAIREDAPMENFISADKPFYLELHHNQVRPPILFLSCSDGGYNYFSSPMEFEYAVLESILGSALWEDVELDLTERIRRVTRDDVTLVASGVGWSGLEEMKVDMRARHEKLSMLLRPLHQKEAELEILQSQFEAVRSAKDLLGEQAERERALIWESYRKNYERFYPESDHRSAAKSGTEIGNQ